IGVAGGLRDGARSRARVLPRARPLTRRPPFGRRGRRRGGGERVGDRRGRGTLARRGQAVHVFDRPKRVVVDDGLAVLATADVIPEEDRRDRFGAAAAGRPSRDRSSRTRFNLARRDWLATGAAETIPWPRRRRVRARPVP